MSFAKGIGGALGWTSGGPIGAVIGFALGAMIDGMTGEAQQTQQRTQQRTWQRPQTPHTTGGDVAMSLVVLTAAVMNADGKVTQRELDYVRRFFTQQFG